MSNAPPAWDAWFLYREKDQSRSSKRKKEDDERKEPGEGQTPRRHRHGGSSSASTAGPPAPPTDGKGKGKSNRSRKGRGDRGKNKGDGKGNDYMDEDDGERGRGNGGVTQPGSLAEHVELHRQVLVRLTDARREDDKRRQFIVEIPEEEPFPGLRKILGCAPDFWRENRPDIGSHSLGPMHEFLFQKFTDWICEQIRANGESATSEQQEELKAALIPWHKFTRVAKTPGGKGAATIISKFVPLGRRDQVPDKGIWRWLLALDLQTSQGRDLHEDITDNPWKWQGLQIRPDRGPVDVLARALKVKLRI